MPLRTEMLTVLPWKGGMNTTQNSAMIKPNELTKADNIIMGIDESKKKRPPINFNFDDASNGTDSLISVHDFWYFSSSVKNQVIVSVSDGEDVFSYTTGGVRTTRTGGTAWASPVTQSTQLTFTNLDLIAVNGAGNLVKKWNGLTATVVDLGGTPPEASILAEHLGRVFCNDKTDPDRLHYSETGDPEIWNGTGDSGALDIRPGDGDPKGITAMVKYQGDFIVFKSQKIYRVQGDAPEFFKITQISDSIGCVGPNAVADIDGNDIVFVSQRGIHSLNAVEAFGDLKRSFLSRDIQKTYNDRWKQSALDNMHIRYLPNENSIAFATLDTEFDSTSKQVLWWYNIDTQSWYRWPNISCESLGIVTDVDQQRLYLGTDTTRLAKAFVTGINDTGTDGTSLPFTYQLETGFISPVSNPYQLISFKNLGLVFQPEGTYNITVCYKIDNLDEQTVTFQDKGESGLLGINFILGESKLGISNSMSAHFRGLEGCGKYIRFRITISAISEILDLQGFLLEYELAGTQQEVIAVTE